MTDELRLVLKRYKRLAIAFSGGNDSLVLAFYAQEVLGAKNVLLLHAASCFVTTQEREVVRRVTLDIQELDVDILKNIDVIGNDAMRCYHCKKQLFSTLQKEAMQRGFSFFADGSNVDDLSEERKGFIASKALNVLYPFIEANMGKDAINKLAKEMNLTSFLHESRACLATRFQTHLPITYRQIQVICKIEDELIEHGFTHVRCRVTPEGYLLEVAPQEIERLKIFTTLPIDPRGYRRS